MKRDVRSRANRFFFDSDGYRLLGTLFLARGNDPKPTAVLLHGMPGIEKNYDLVLYLREAGWNSLNFHYRGCWGSTGIFSFRSIPGDVISALDEVCSGRYPQVDPKAIVLIGHSLDGWAAVLAAAVDPRVKAVLVIAPIADPKNFNLTIREAPDKYCPWLPGLVPERFVHQWHNLDETYYPIEKVDKLLLNRP